MSSSSPAGAGSPDSSALGLSCSSMSFRGTPPGAPRAFGRGFEPGRGDLTTWLMARLRFAARRSAPAKTRSPTLELIRSRVPMRPSHCKPRPPSLGLTFRYLGRPGTGAADRFLHNQRLLGRWYIELVRRYARVRRERACTQDDSRPRG